MDDSNPIGVTLGHLNGPPAFDTRARVYSQQLDLMMTMYSFNEGLIRINESKLNECIFVNLDLSFSSFPM